MVETELQFAVKTVFPLFMDMPSLKNPLPKRKKGNRLLMSFAKQIGEAGFDREPAVLKLVLAICHDNNYKIRMDGALFFKDYLQESSEKVLGHPRFKQVYVGELLEFLQDEEAYIRIEALEVVTNHLEHLERPDIEGDYINEVLRTLTADAEDIQMRIAELLGQIVHKLAAFDLHLKHR